MSKLSANKKSNNNTCYDDVKKEVEMVQTLLGGIKSHKEEMNQKLREFNNSDLKESNDVEVFMTSFSEIKQKLDEVMAKIDPELVHKVQQLDEGSSNLLDVSISHLKEKKLSMKKKIKKLTG